MGVLTTGIIAGGLGLGAKLIGDRQKKKAEESLLRRTEEEQARLEDKTSMQPYELDRLERMMQMEEEYQNQLKTEQGLSGEQLLRNLGPGVEQYINQITNESANPDQYYESTLQPQLELARQMVNAEANRSGRFGGLPQGGLRFENLGRAGVDLAIKEAQGRMSARNNAMNRMSGFMESSRTAKNQAGANYSGFLKDLQSLSDVSRARETGGVNTAAQLAQPVITDTLAQRAGASGQDMYSLSDLLFNTKGVQNMVNRW